LDQGIETKQLSSYLRRETLGILSEEIIAGVEAASKGGRSKIDKNGSICHIIELMV
jgi:hypothetical protein